MTRFEESALRESAADAQQNGSTLPYWHPSSNFSSLIDPDCAVGQQPVPFDGTASGFDLNNDAPFGDLSVLAHDLSPDLHHPDAMPSMAAFTQAMSAAKTQQPSGSGARTMRRPGLAGAHALVNGQYCCHWSVNNAACRHRFLDPKSLNDHIRSHHIRGATKFVCQWSGCDKGSFPTANKLLRHVHSHTGYKPFPCPSCTQAFVTKDQLDKHVTTHTGAKDFVCSWPGCDRSFAVKHALDGHVNSVHLKAKKHICPHCSQAFDDSSNLSKHKKQVHHPDTGIKCPARHTHGCMYVDSRKDKMKEHCERHRHGLETVTDPHAWAFWVQQFRSTSKKAESRRSSRPISRASSLLSCTTTASTTLAAAAAAAVPPDCDSQACTLPVCHHPCTLLCHDLFPAHDPFSQPCDADDCDGLEPCTDDPCTDPHCDFSQYPCDLWHPPCDLPPSSCPAPPCNMPVCPPQCRSATSTPSSVPHTPYESARDSSSSSLYSYGDTFHGTEHPFHMQPADEYMFMNQ